MAATAAEIARLRRLTDETTDETYADADIQEFIEEHPLIDERGEEPYTWDASTQPPTKDENDDWIPTYDLNAAAADIWEEKASAPAQDFDFNADGASYKRSQAYEHAMRQARYFRSKRSPKTITQRMSEKEEIEDNIFNVNNPYS